MDYNIAPAGSHLQVTLQGDFTFIDNLGFRNLLTNLNTPNLATLSLDFSHVTLVDSAALGMLLLLREEAHKRNIAIILQHPGGQVKKIFDLSRFDQLFTIEHGA